MVVLTVVDRFSKARPKLPSAKETAVTVVDQVFRIHGLPIDVVSDRGPRSNPNFGEFCRLLGASVSLSSGFHPQSKGQTERANQDLERVLRCLVAQNPTSWCQQLSWVEYAHNSLPVLSMGLSPFECSLGYQPPIFPSLESEVAVPSAHAFVQRCHRTWRRARETLLRMGARTKAQADRHRSKPPVYVIGQRTTRSVTTAFDDYWLDILGVSEVRWTTNGRISSDGKTIFNNGERLALFCEHNGLCIGNTYFQHRRIHKKTWRSPDGQNFNEIDFICVSQKWRSSLRDVRVYRGADIGSDHYLVRADIKLKLCNQRQPIPKRPFTIEKFKYPSTADDFTLELHNRFASLEEVANVEDLWGNLRDTTRECAQNIIGRRRGRQKEQWIQDRSWKLIDERKTAKLKRDQAKIMDEKEEGSRRYAGLDRLVKKSYQTNKKEWLERKGAEAQEAADRNDSKTLYRILHELTGTKSNSSVPIKDKNGKLLIAQDEQNKR
ncbi:uncharacterized protein LOC131553967 [Onychostoma macrolepis]|uniref:uncharacterized protein LOC131553967 n=1 Tax=Onychostoma macrolepis TaxID=369639 RepID=UPI00272A0FC6|nr:uncharacterized protein LOC131553967 [Onychostoma macrolepis]